MVNKKRSAWRFAVGCALLCCTILVWGWLIPMNAQCAQSKITEVQGKNLKTQEPEDTLKSAIRKLEDTKSIHTKITMNMEVEAFRLNLDAQASIDMIAFQSPYKIKSESRLDMGLLGEKEWTVYATKQGKGYQLYEKNGKKWTVQETPAKELLKYDGRNLMKIFLSQIEELSEVETVVLNGNKTLKYIGVLRSDGLKKIFFDAEGIELVSSLFQNSMLKPFGSLLEQQEKVETMMENSEDVEVTLWIDKTTGYPVQCKMDITDMLGSGYKDLTESLSSKQARKIAEKIEIMQTEIIIECDDFNEAEEFVLPE